MILLVATVLLMLHGYAGLSDDQVEADVRTVRVEPAPATEAPIGKGLRLDLPATDTCDANEAAIVISHSLTNIA